MKHVFIINPNAGKKNMMSFVLEELKKLEEEINFTYTVYVTKAINDAFMYVKEMCAAYHDPIRFYACGGDGTLNEVINGSINHPNCSVTCVPIGSGNDFIKNFAVEDQFTNIKALINGKEERVDLLKVNDRYTVNISNFGFDAFVAYNMAKFKNKLFIRGKMAYNIAVFYSLLFKTKHPCQIYLDNDLVFDGKMLLSAVANGVCYGGGYYCTPLAKINDGIMDVCIVKTLSRLRLVGLIKSYKLGKHLEDPRIAKYIIYQKAKTVTIKTPHDMIYCMDGEIAQAKEIQVEILQQSLRFVVPN